MIPKNAKNIKHPELVEYYHSYQWDKAPYRDFFARVTRWCYSTEEAIRKDFKKPNPRNSEYDDNGRICRDCNKYKPRSDYHNSKVWLNKRTQNCIECRNKNKQEYRQNNRRSKDHEYKQKKRKLEVWEIIATYNPIIYEWNPRENKLQVLHYRYKKWYYCKSLLTGDECYISLWDNATSVKIYKIQEDVKQKEELKKEITFSWIPC